MIIEYLKTNKEEYICSLILTILFILSNVKIDLSLTFLFIIIEGIFTGFELVSLTNLLLLPNTPLFAKIRESEFFPKVVIRYKYSIRLDMMTIYLLSLNVFINSIWILHISIFMIIFSMIRLYKCANRIALILKIAGNERK